jgi:hypothetical protein
MYLVVWDELGTHPPQSYQVPDLLAIAESKLVSLLSDMDSTATHKSTLHVSFTNVRIAITYIGNNI